MDTVHTLQGSYWISKGRYWVSRGRYQISSMNLELNLNNYPNWRLKWLRPAWMWYHSLMSFTSNSWWMSGFMRMDLAHQAACTNLGSVATKSSSQHYQGFQKEHSKGFLSKFISSYSYILLLLTSGSIDNWVTPRPIMSSQMVWHVLSHASHKASMTMLIFIIFLILFFSTWLMINWMKIKSMSHALIQGGMSSGQRGRRH